MIRRFALPLLAAVGLFVVSAPEAQAQNVIVVKLVDKSATEFAFEPAEVVVKPGDIIRWEQTTATPHNIDVREGPKAGFVSDYLLTTGQTFELAIDWPAGDYKYVCTPHEFMGMIGKITVQAEETPNR